MSGYNTKKTPTGPNPMGQKSMGPSATPVSKAKPAVIPALPIVTQATEEEIHRTIK